MAMTLRLTDSEQAALRERADAEGISMQEAARRAVREFVAKGQHRERVASRATLIIRRHEDALRRLGE
jgi:hypothetical protein